MKNLLKTALLLVVISAPLKSVAASGSFLPRPVRAIASIISQGGFAPPEFRKPNGVEILVNGLVVKVEKGVRTKTVAQLSSEVTQALIQKVDAVQSGDLIDTDAGKPMCMDAPVTSFSVMKTNGQKIAIGRLSGCHSFELQNGSDVYQIRETLEGLRQLSYLAQ